MLKTDLLESYEVVRQPGLALEHGRVGALKVERKLVDELRSFVSQVLPNVA